MYTYVCTNWGKKQGALYHVHLLCTLYDIQYDLLSKKFKGHTKSVLSTGELSNSTGDIHSVHKLGTD